MKGKKLNPDHIKEVIRIADESHFSQMMNLEVVEIGEEYAKVRLNFEDRHRNALMNIHGGVYASMLDAVTWWAVYSEIPERIGYTTIDLNVNDFSMHRGGTLYGEAKAIRVGRSIAMSEGWVKDENGRILAFGTSKLMILDEKSSLEAAIEGLGHDPLPRKFIDIED